MTSRATFGQLLAACVLALAGAALATFVWPQMRRSDGLLRGGVTTEATVVALERATCYASSARKNRPYPCFLATGAWRHDDVAYRAALGYYRHAYEAPVGTAVRILFAPDPAAAAGNADLQLRVVPAGREAPRSERPVYLGLLALAGLLCVPLPTVLLRMLRG